MADGGTGFVGPSAVRHPRSAARQPAYTLHMSGFSDHCVTCNQDFPYGLPLCQTCRKPACEICVVRMGGNIFCGKPCAHAFFFGGQDDVEDENDLAKLEDGE